jgi:hypothetical protein
VQYGVFSPILRLHSTNNPFHERRPWGWDAETARVTSQALRLRHRLIPYIYSMAWRNHTQHQPLVRPMYHDYAEDEQAYHCPDQYTFGSELLAAPFLEPLDAQTRLSRKVVWLPDEEWFGFFDGLSYAGGGWQAIYGGLEDIPVFARAGAIVPLALEVGWGGLDNPQELEIHLFPGADNDFMLYEDDGLQGSSLTPLAQSWSGEQWQVNIGPVQGETAHLPASRSYRLLFRGLAEGSDVTAVRNGHEDTVLLAYDQKLRSVCVTLEGVLTADQVTITVSAGDVTAVDSRLAQCRKVVHAARIESYAKQALDRELAQIVANPALLEKYQLLLTQSQLRALVEIIGGAGFHEQELRHKPGEEIILWNNNGAQNMRYKLAALDVNRHAQTVKGALPSFAVLTRDEQALTYHAGSQPARGRMTIDNWLAALPQRVDPRQVGLDEAAIGFMVQGENGRAVTLILRDGRAVLQEGVGETADVVISASPADWLALINGETIPQELFVQGKIELQGDMALLLQLASAFEIVAPGIYQPDHWRLTIDYMDLLHWQRP